MQTRSLTSWRTWLVNSGLSADDPQAEDLTSLQKEAQSLKNGLTLPVFERHRTSVFSAFTHVDVGSNQGDVSGLGGLAHMPPMSRPSWPSRPTAQMKNINQES